MEAQSSSTDSMFSAADVELIFGNMPQLLENQKKFLADLQECVRGKWLFASSFFGNE
jgi:hypothetical protein